MDSLMDGGDDDGAGKTAAPGSPRALPKSNRPPVEDRALQAVLAARRRSLENSGKPEPVKRKKERKVVQPEETDSTVHLTEALRAISKGNIQTALNSAMKACETGSDPNCLVVRGRCHLLLGHLEGALQDAQKALEQDSSLVKAVLVQAEALYGMGEFERSLVLFHRGARRRPDLTAFTKGVHKAREAIINAIGVFARLKSAETTNKGDAFPDDNTAAAAAGEEDAASAAGNANDEAATSPGSASSSRSGKEPKDTENKEGNNSGKKQRRAPLSVPTMNFSEKTKSSRMASKRLLGGLNSDKEFLASLVERKSLQDEFITTSIKSGTPGGLLVGRSGREVAKVATEALNSLQHLESFMWQRNPGGSLAEKKTGKKKTAPRGKYRVKVDLLLKQLKENTEGSEPWLQILNEAENFVTEVRESGTAGRLLCRLLTAIGTALPAADRGEDAVAVLTDAIHVAKENEFMEGEVRALNALGKVLCDASNHQEAVIVWEKLIPISTSSLQRGELFFHLCKSYFVIGKVETGRFYGSKCVSEAEAAGDSSTAAAALLQLAQADADQGDTSGVQKSLDRCQPFLNDVPEELQKLYSSIRNNLPDNHERRTSLSAAVA